MTGRAGAGRVVLLHVVYVKSLKSDTLHVFCIVFRINYSIFVYFLIRCQIVRYHFFLRRKWIICTYRYVVRNDAFLRKLSKMIGFSRFKD